MFYKSNFFLMTSVLSINVLERMRETSSTVNGVSYGSRFFYYVVPFYAGFFMNEKIKLHWFIKI